MRYLPLAVAVSMLLLAACQPSQSPPVTQAQTASKPASDFTFAEASVADLQRQMAAGTLSSHTLTSAYLDRIAAIDRSGPTLHSVLTTNPNALEEADALDAERKAGTVRGPLHGIPVLIKDNIDATPMANTAGSLALADYHPKNDAFLIQKLRAAGAVILGKTNLSEWANFRSSRSISGWSAVGGQTKNPYALDRNPCGSSAGTGTAIAANLAAVGVGTETDGSIICPSSVAGLVGLKPTVGLVSRSGIIPISISQDTAGPMTRSVADAAALLTAMAAPDPQDPASSERKNTAAIDYTQHLKANALKGARIGVVRQLMGYRPEVNRLMEDAIVKLKAAGATVVDAEIPTLGQWGEAEYTMLQYELKDGLQRYLVAGNAPYRSLSEIIAFNKRNADAEMPLFGQEVFEQANALGPLSTPEYITLRDKVRRLAGPEGIDVALHKQQLDALVAPATAPAWPTDPVNGDHYAAGGYGAASAARYPSLTVPMGDVHGLPVGLVLMGTAWSEPRLIELGYAFEQATHARKPPQLLPTVAPSKDAH
ncbi:MAG: amidase [Thermomonas sp.]|uniref:amidase n=1 Tax=Thermomonas sp. TaxID=1971895 RepID=UPI001EC64C82|nr:amidase [Thermomonas sp.]MBV2209263.1 amidase [Thermomonas sp.]